MTRPLRAEKTGPATKKTAAAVKPIRGGKSSQPALTIEMIDTDAETARRWLDLMDINRRLRKRQVTTMKRDMIAGNWRPVGDPIRFDTTGALRDGQHRLEALLAADEEKPGIVVPFIVVSGIAPEDVVVIDTGARRTPGDQLRLAGYPHYTLLASAARWAIICERKVMYDAANRDVTHAEILEYVQGNDLLQESVAFVMNRMVKLVPLPPTHLAVTYYMSRKINPKMADEFMARLIDGANLAVGDPVLALRNRANDLVRKRTSMSAEGWVSLLFRTWNLKREKKSMRTIPVFKADGSVIPVPDLI